MKKNLITKTLFLAMGLCVASGITATLVSSNKSAVTVHAEAQKIGDSDTTWELKEEGKLLVIAGTGDMPDFNYPSDQPWHSYQSIKNIVVESGVTRIGNYAFEDVGEVTNVTISNSVLTIGEDAICENTYLTSITIPNSVTTIESYAFEANEALESIVIPSSVTTIDDGVFSDCYSLNSVSLNDGLLRIGNEAFIHCISLENITIPKTVTSIGKDLFCDTPSLTAINVDEDNSNYVSVDGVLLNKEMTTLIKYPSAKEGEEYIIPETVTSMGAFAFQYCSSLTKVDIPDTITLLPNSAFHGCSSLASINLPNALTYIGFSAFDTCSALTNVTIPENVTEIDGYAFADCSKLETIIVKPLTPPTLSYDVFRNSNKISKVYVPIGKAEGEGGYKTDSKWSSLSENIAEAAMVYVNSIGEGDIKVNKDYFPVSDFPGSFTVEVTATPKEGYDLKGLSYYTTNPSETIDIFNTKSFNMPQANVTIVATFEEHVHIIKEIHDKVDSTCVEAGHETYYECECGAFFSDEGLTKEITNLQAWLAEDGEGYIAPKGHSTTRVPGVAPTETSDGYKDAFKCNACGKYFEDADATRLIGDETAYNSWKLGEGKIPALNPQGNKELSGGAIAGIAVGSVVGVCLIAYVTMFFVWKKNEKALKFLKPSFVWINKKIFRK